MDAEIFSFFGDTVTGMTEFQFCEIKIISPLTELKFYHPERKNRLNFPKDFNRFFYRSVQPFLLRFDV
jgi:hypothetical protein